MNTEARYLLSNARSWLARDIHLVPRDPSEEQLLHLSNSVSELLHTDSPDEAALSRAAMLFDQIASRHFGNDPFGERYEIAMTLAFVAWRHSMLLDMERDSLEWLAVSDRLATEEMAELTRLEDFLYLPGEQRSEALCESFLASPIDVFLSLAILRRDRARKPRQVVEAAISIHAFLKSLSEEPRSPEEAFFRTEAAWLAATELRMFGRMADTKSWLAIAKHERRKMKASDGMRLKLQLISLLLNRERHQYRRLLARFRVLRERCIRLGLYREAVTCRYAETVTEKIQGRFELADREFELLFEECKDTEYSSIAALSLGQIARKCDESGFGEKAKDLFAQAFQLVSDCGDEVSLGSLILEIGDVRLREGRPYEAARIFQIASAYYLRVGAGYWRAYAEVLAAESFLNSERPLQALKALGTAFPLIKREAMQPEGVHALKILSKIASRADARYGSIAELVAEMQKGI